MAVALGSDSTNATTRLRHFAATDLFIARVRFMTFLIAITVC